MPKIKFSHSKKTVMETTENLTEIFGTVYKQNGICWVKPCDKNRQPYLLGTIKNLHNNDLVEIMPTNNRRSNEAELIKNYGTFSLSLLDEILVTKKYKIPETFDEATLLECKNFDDFNQTKRTDLCSLPFVTIDGDDSKDFDDAVYATSTDFGFKIIVAIADVAFYVKPHSRLDTEAYKRGNSVYLPQRVIPMLPEILSNDLCSLNPKVKRPVIACFMEIDKHGNLLNYRFERAIIKSVARLTYKEVDNAFYGQFNSLTKQIFTTVINPLYQAYFALEKARKSRGTLEIEGCEVKIKFSKNGEICNIEKRQNLTSNKLIEEFMIAANVAAANFISNFKTPIMYRIHEKPLEEKLQELKPLLNDLKLRLPEYSALLPKHLNKIIEICRQKNNSHGIDDLVLRLQCQAKYSPHNCGHFGLNLKKYVHFTSPIRRYSDLIIHRLIIFACNMEKDTKILSLKAMEETAEHLCTTERTAVAIERDITARYISSYLKPLTGAEFELKISGLSNAGIFVRIEELGAEGLIPMRTLPRDFYQLLDADTTLRGVETKLKFRLGDNITARLTEAEPVTGGLIFAYLPDRMPETKNKKTKKTKHKKRSKCSKK